MTNAAIRRALVAGVESVTAWSGLLDRINVFPVADGDTGRNLVISLAPLRRTDADLKDVAHELLFSARGNAGNIAARFFHAFIRTDAPGKLAGTIRQGRDQAWQAVADPQPGTMLTFFDGLADIVSREPVSADEVWVKRVMDHLTRVVGETTSRQPRLAQAGVVDAGALGMYLYFDGFLNALAGRSDAYCPVTSLFQGKLEVRPAAAEQTESGYCVDMILEPHERVGQDMAFLAQMSESVVVIREGDYLKVHLHTPDRARTRRDMEAFSHVLRWSEDDLGAQTVAFRDAHARQAIHIMTDAAGSLTRDQARPLDVTLLDSYINLDKTSMPESCLTPGSLYGAMNKGIPVSTSQASVYERHQSYQSALSLYGRVLYLCVGSFFTGNYAAAVQWKKDHDPGDNLAVMDTGCAAGRLGLLAQMTARFAGRTDDPARVIAFAGEAVHRCREYIFIDKLQYLAAGGRMSKTGAFFGDMMRMKPIISPQADGAKNVGVVRNRRAQAAFAVKKLQESLKPESRSVIWLEYTDNGEWVGETFQPEIRKRYPLAEIVVKPLSLTTGVHTGPGSWGLAFFADEKA